MKRTALTLSLVLSICIAIPTMGFAYPAIIGQPGGEPGAEFIYGDATGNDLVTADDATVIVAYYVGLVDGSLIQVSASDVSLDTTINVIDALMVWEYIGDYNSLDEKLLMACDSDSGLGVLTNPVLINNTGKVWTEFDFTLDTYTSDFPVFFTTPAGEYSFLQDPYVGPGTYTVSNEGRSLHVVGLDIGVGESFSFNLNFDSVGSGYYGLFGQPIPIPEPNTALLLGSGLIGLGGFRKKLRNR